MQPFEHVLNHEAWAEHRRPKFQKEMAEGVESVVGYSLWCLTTSADFNLACYVNYIIISLLYKHMLHKMCAVQK